jgi:DNA-binding winged helix-turn-helix (wHTH) protein
VALTARATDLLIVLIERRGQVVEKDELLQLLWPDTVVEENNLTVKSRRCARRWPPDRLSGVTS